MKIKLILFIVTVLISVSLYAYFTLPPYYITVNLTLANLKEENYENLSDIIERKLGPIRYSIVVDELFIEGAAVEHSSNEEKLIADLMKNTNIILMVNEKKVVLFYLAEGNRVSVHYRVALAKNKRATKNDMRRCGDQIFAGDFGECIFELDSYWGIYYFWVKKPD